MALVAPGRYRLPTRPSTRATVDGETTGSKLGPYRLLGKQATPLSSQATAPPSMTKERAGIFGIEEQDRQTFNRVIASGAKQQVGLYVSLNPDCTATGDVTVRVTKQPEHGTVDTVATTGYAHYSKENIRSKCNQHKV